MLYISTLSMMKPDLLKKYNYWYLLHDILFKKNMKTYVKLSKECIAQ